MTVWYHSLHCILLWHGCCTWYISRYYFLHSWMKWAVINFWNFRHWVIRKYFGTSHTEYMPTWEPNHGSYNEPKLWSDALTNWATGIGAENSPQIQLDYQAGSLCSCMVHYWSTSWRSLGHLQWLLAAIESADCLASTWTVPSVHGYWLLMKFLRLYYHHSTKLYRKILSLLPSVLLRVCSTSNNANGNKRVIFFSGIAWW